MTFEDALGNHATAEAPHVSIKASVGEDGHRRWTSPCGIDGCITIIMTIFVTRIKLSHPSSRSYPDSEPTAS